MAKKAVTEVSLVDESSEETNREIERQIAEELSKNLQSIPWAAKVEKTTVRSC